MVSVSLWGTSLLEKKPIIEEEQQERIFQDTENRFMDNNITRATTGLHAESLAGEESLLDPLASETATGNFQGIPITQAKPTTKALYRLTHNGWECRSEGEWKATDRFASHDQETSLERNPEKNKLP